MRVGVVLKRLKLNLLPLSILLIIPTINVSYALLNNTIRGCHSLVTSLDMAVPFIKEFIIAYWMWFPFMFVSLVYLCFNYRNTYYKCVITMVLGMITCYIIYFFFQTTVPRPVVSGNDIFSRAVKFTYGWDKPFNCFPSIHVLASYIIMIASRKLDKKPFIKFAMNFIGISVIVSTQFVKQHVILDMVFAILLVEIIYRFIAGFILERGLIWKKKLYWWLTMKKKLET